MTGRFQPRANLVARLGAAAVLMFPVVLGLTAYAYTYSSYETGVGRFVSQPIPFSHAHHVGGLGLHCLHCHATAETQAFAGMPNTDTCMNCHAQIWTEAAVLGPLRASWRNDDPIAWNRVHDLAEFVFFDHAVHVQAGVGCSSCHGQVDRMPLTYQVETLHMEWCLDCHRDPGPHLRAPGEIYEMEWQPRSEREGLSAERLRAMGVEAQGLTNCTACHR